MNNKREELIMINQKDKNDNADEMVVRLVGKGFGIKKKNGKVYNCKIINIILEEDVLSDNIKGLTIKDETYFDGTQDKKYNIGGFSKSNQDLQNKDFYQNLLNDDNYSIFHKICEKEYFCSFDATINLNNFNNTLCKVGNFKIIEDSEKKNQIDKLLKKKRKTNKNCTTGYSFKFKNLETGAEWKRLLKTMNSDHLSPLAQTLYLTCLLFQKDETNKIARESIDYYASNFTEQEREDGLKELIAQGYFKDAKIRYLVRKENASRKNTKIPKRNCCYTYDSNILQESKASSMAIGYYIACIESSELNNSGVVSKESFRKYFGWSSSQADEGFKELEKLGYIQTIKVKDQNTKKILNIYLFRKSLDQEFCDVEKEFPNYRIVKK